MRIDRWSGGAFAANVLNLTDTSHSASGTWLFPGLLCPNGQIFGWQSLASNLQHSLANTDTSNSSRIEFILFTGTRDQGIRMGTTRNVNAYINNTVPADFQIQRNGIAQAAFNASGLVLGSNGSRALAWTGGATKPITTGTTNDTITVANCLSGDIAFVTATDNTLPVQVVVVATNGSVPFNSIGFNGKTAIAHVTRYS
jgi:hypothetical protein